MNFNSIDFILVFLPIVFFGFRFCPPKFRLSFLLLSSLIFYGYSGLLPVGLLLVSSIIVFVFAQAQSKKAGGLLAALAVLLPLSVLFMFKYLNFSLSLLNFELPHTYPATLFFVVLPAGISFYTFQLISYFIDVRSGKIEAEKQFTKFFLYVSFFPQLIAGPIPRYQNIEKQLSNLVSIKNIRFEYEAALKFISIGLFAKVCVADLITILINKTDPSSKDVNLGFFDTVFILNAYSLKIFFDFWAYSLMAIGLAKLFGISLPINFKEPYQALNPKEFWRKWHVTLSYWLRDYLYIKLGGNKRYIRNILIVFVLCGLWHGAGANFMLWGALHAAFVIFYDLIKKTWNVAPEFFQILLTYSLVTLSWPLFFMGLGEYINFLLGLFRGNLSDPVYGLKHWLVLVVPLFWVMFSKEKFWLYNTKKVSLLDSPLLHSTLFFVALIFARYSETFIYFRF